MKKKYDPITDPKPWFEYSRKQRKIADILFNYMLENQLVSKLNTSDGRESYLTIFVNAHYHWGISIENGLKGIIIKYLPDLVQYERSENRLKVKKIANNNHDLLHLAELAKIFHPASELYKHDSDYEALKEVLKHLSEMVKWGAKYPMPMDSAKVRNFTDTVPSKLVFGFHILDVMEPLFQFFDKEDSDT
jgi:hypothetical protein